MECWFWNIDTSVREFLSAELNEGRLRQGWGYDARLDLRLLESKLDTKNIFDPEEQAAWDRCSPILLYIKKGDFVVVKNIPSAEEFTIVEVVGDYCFHVSEKGDYGHILPVRVVNTFHKYSKVVPSPFTNALNREQNPVRITYKHSSTVKNLARITATEEKDIPEQFKNKMSKWRKDLLPTLKKTLREGLTASETERLVLEMMRRDGIDPLWNAGAGEKGADILCDIQLGYGLTSKIAVQVKMHWDHDSDTTGVDQLEKAFTEHSVQAGLLVSMADKVGDNVLERVKQANKNYNIRVLCGEELYTRLLELIADPNLELP